MDCPKDFVDLKAVLPQIERVMAYAGPSNFTGAPLPGYSGTRAWIHESCLESLQAIVLEFEEQGLRLRLFDAYRPRRAVAAMMSWAASTGQKHLIEEGYLSANSRHSKGCAIDVTLVSRTSGEPLDMGSQWDAFCVESHSSWGEGVVRTNRALLREPFVRHGWRAAQTEWWHFDRELEGLDSLDVPYTREE